MKQHRSAALMASLLLATAGLSSCAGGLLDSELPATSTWWLSPAALTTDAAASPAEVVKFRLTVVPGLDSNQVLTLSEDAVLIPVAGGLWAEHLPELLQSLTMRSLGSAGKYQLLPLPARGPDGACTLALEVQQFWFRLDAARQPRTADFAVEGSLQCPGQTPPGHLRAFSASPVASTSRADLIAAMQASLEDVMQQVHRALNTHSSG